MKIAFAGTGYISKIHAQAVQSLGHQLEAVVNHKPDSMAAFASQFAIPRQYQTIERMIADGDIDAIIISTPNYLHAPQSIAALQAGIAVMVEKPMALNAVEAQAMADAAATHHTPLMVAHCWRFDEEVLWLKQRVADLGPIIRTKGLGVHANWGPSGWFATKQYAGGGALVDMGVHAIDTARVLLRAARYSSSGVRLSALVPFWARSRLWTGSGLGFEGLRYGYAALGRCRAS